jgi:hypothetical protein
VAVAEGNHEKPHSGQPVTCRNSDLPPPGYKYRALCTGQHIRSHDGGSSSGRGGSGGGGGRSSSSSSSSMLNGMFY